MTHFCTYTQLIYIGNNIHMTHVSTGVNRLNTRPNRATSPQRSLSPPEDAEIENGAPQRTTKPAQQHKAAAPSSAGLRTLHRTLEQTGVCFGGFDERPYASRTQPLHHYRTKHLPVY